MITIFKFETQLVNRTKVLDPGKGWAGEYLCFRGLDSRGKRSQVA